MEANPAAMETAQRRLRMVNAHLQLKASGMHSSLLSLSELLLDSLIDR